MLMKIFKRLRHGLYGLLFFGAGATLWLALTPLTLHEVALRTLSVIKTLNGDDVNLQSLDRGQYPLVDHSPWTQLLQKHISDDGRVNYQGFIDDRIALHKYLDELSKTGPGDRWTRAQKIAYWINAYNAFTIKLVIDHYPVESIKEIAEGLPMINSPWDLKFFRIGSVDFDLNTIEHDLLRALFQEPRIHFAINCASISCPNLRAEAYRADTLEQQLEEQALSFITDPEKNTFGDREVELSAIFKWFRTDFTQSGDLLTYIQAYQPHLDLSQISDSDVAYRAYNWDLNELQKNDMQRARD